MRSLARLTLLVLPIALAGGAEATAQDKSWVGENVLHTRPQKDIKFGDRIDGKQVYFPFSGRWPFKVRDEKDGWLRIHDGRNEGWVDKADFVLAKNAFEYFDGRVRANAKDTFALTMRGAYWTDKQQYDKAIADFNGCLEINPKDYVAFHNRGVAHNAKKEYDKAIADFGEALALNPKYTVTLVNRGLAWRNKSEWDKAIADYDEALKIEPRYANAHFGRAAAYRAKKEYDQAIKDLDATLDIDDKHVAAWNDRGLCYSLKKEYTKAVKDYDEALRINPKNTVTYLNRGVAHKATKQYGKAIADYEDALRLDPKYAKVQSNLAWVLATCPEEKYRNGKRAVELATKASESTKGKDAGYLDVLAAAHAEVGNFDEAVRLEKQALESESFATLFGKGARNRLKLYESKQPYRE
jgi:tetratricopeptide (TPR) repeat protein